MPATGSAVHHAGEVGPVWRTLVLCNYACLSAGS